MPISADAEEQGQKFDTVAEHNPTVEEVAQKYPLHFAIINTQSPAVTEIIKAHFKSHPSSIHKADASGFTPIHAALGIANVRATQTLLELNVAQDLQNAENARGMTPLEGLAAEMRSTREFVETMMGEWNGYAPDQLKCEFLARRAMGMPTVVDDMEAYSAKRKLGCTCGVCAGGWLSKRMWFRLNVQAGMSSDMMNQEMDQFKRGVAHEDPTSLLDNASDYLPPHLHQSVFKSFYVGYQSVFYAIHFFLEKTNLPLDKQAIAQRIHRQEGVGFFLGKGGKIEYAFDAITDVARMQSPLGDSTFEEIFGEDEAYASLPTCDNDLEFDLVRRMIGLGTKLKWGPYYARDEDLGIDDDDEDENEDNDDAMGGIVVGGLADVNVLQEMLRRAQAGQAL